MANQYSADVPKGFNVPKQVRLDSITGVQNETTLKNLGDGNNLAFKYYEGLKIYCKDEKTEYIWREVVGIETGLLDSHFIYPTYSPIDGINYSGKTFNFFLISNTNNSADGSETKINAGTNVTITGTGTVSSPYVINSTNTVADGSETKVNQGGNITITGIGTIANPYIINADLTDLGIVKTIDNEIIAPGQSLSIINTESTGKILVTKEYVQSIIPTTPDGSETKLNAGSNIFITGTGTTLNPYIINSSVENNITYINAGDNISLSGTGTITTPYVITGQYSPFEKIDEGNGNGYIIRERNNTFYGNIGTDAIDFSYSNEISSINGATGINSFAIGDHVIASNYLSSSFGYRVNNNGIGSFNTGFKLIDNGYTNFLTGIGHNVTSMNVTVVGQASNIISEQILDFNSTTTKALFVVGNGTIENGTEADFNVLTRSDAFIVRMNGLATLPSVTNALITADTTGKAIVTKEYLNLQKVITYPADFIGTNYILTDADNDYEIIVDNGATAVSITVPSGLTSKIGVGFTQKGTADVSYIASGTTINNPIGLKIKGQYYQTYLSQELATNIFYLGGNTKI